jgi:2,4-dienoyl-CoA reductase-like NADH-dependent reductase (Old Yellow Enzyme family)
MDRYGCHIEDRRRFLLDVYQGVRSKVAEGALIICRLGVADRCSRGLALSDGIATASELEKKGARLLDISSGWGVPRGIQTEGSPFSGMLHLAKAVRSAISIPVIGGGGLYHPDLAEKAIRDGFVDLVAVGRGLLADPSWVRKTVEGRPESIAVCRKCKPCYHHTNSQRCPARKKTIQPKQA